MSNLTKSAPQKVHQITTESIKCNTISFLYLTIRVQCSQLCFITVCIEIHFEDSPPKITQKILNKKHHRFHLGLVMSYLA